MFKKKIFDKIYDNNNKELIVYKEYLTGKYIFSVNRIFFDYMDRKNIKCRLIYYKCSYDLVDSFLNYLNKQEKVDSEIIDLIENIINEN